ncbi:Transcription factor GLABRA 3 -like protein [Gossypium arboreum]|uniref:Transcription factor GLABRA 3-like protein n=1 Tax=Gossypium arboreum TaxID=29729 RepID=A0A0B0PE18_GOSAR|nr:Transcription factor GLABRA 3 -like protein [Gossypium arboreum]
MKGKTKPTIHDSQNTGTFKQQDDTIKYLERRVEELVTCSELMELETRTKRQPRDGVERTSDNYGSNKNITSRKKKYVNKRKASDIGEAELEIECVASKDNVVVIQFRCPWRDGLDALSNSQFGLPFILRIKCCISTEDLGSVKRVV